MNKRQRKKAERKHDLFIGKGRYQWWWLAEAAGPPTALTFELLDEMVKRLKERNGQQKPALR